MIINANGILRAKVLTVSKDEIDSRGYPIKSDDNWGEPIECNITTNTHSSIGITVNGNEFETSAFEVLIEEQPFDADIVELVRDGVNLGIFQVQGKPEFLAAVGNIKILAKYLLSV